jgi:hypothetical protein
MPAPASDVGVPACRFFSLDFYHKEHKERKEHKELVVSRFVFGARVCDPQRLGLHGDVLRLIEPRSRIQDTAKEFETASLRSLGSLRLIPPAPIFLPFPNLCPSVSTRG